jgi:hypothetical protein
MNEIDHFNDRDHRNSQLITSSHILPVLQSVMSVKATFGLGDGGNEEMMKRISVHPPSDHCQETARTKWKSERNESATMSEIW